MMSAETWGGSDDALGDPLGDPAIARSAALARSTAADAALRAIAGPAPRTLRLADLPGPRAGLAAGLGDETDATDLDAALHAFDHVVDRERGDRRGGHRLHLDTGLGGRRGLGADPQDARRTVGRDPDHEIGEGQRVAQRDELGRALAAHHAGQLGDGEDIALRAAAVDDEAERLG